MQIYFLQPVLIIFTRGAINSEHDCLSVTCMFTGLNEHEVCVVTREGVITCA